MLSLRLPAPLLERLNQAAPPAPGRWAENSRSALIRDALERELARIEREAADLSLIEEAS